MPAAKDGTVRGAGVDLEASSHRAADILIDQLVACGVGVVFGIPGGAIAPINDALLDRREIRVVTTRHESGAVFAAAGYARATGKLGVVIVTSGPGVLNCMTGIASAYCDNIPLLVLAGEVPTTVFGKGALQEGSSASLNVVGMAKHITKLSLEARSASGVPATLRRAVDTALSGRPGPVLLTLPLDVTTAVVPAPRIAGHTRVEFEVDEGALADAGRILSDARRGVIFAGSGVRVGDAPARLLALAERLQMPVMTSLKGKGVFPESHPLSLGVFGYGANPSTSKYLDGGTDCVLAVGTGLGDVATSGWSNLLAGSESFIQIDTEALHIGRSYSVTIGLVGSADDLLGRLLVHTPQRLRPMRYYGVKTATDPMVVLNGPNGMVAPQRALWELQRALPWDTVFTCDIGDHLLFAAHYLRVTEPDGFIAMTGLASMGSAIGAAMGAQLAYPDRQVAAICGDGGFAMSLPDVAAAVHNRIPIVIAVLNDRRYGMVERGDRALFGRTPEYPIVELDIARTAKALGADAYQITRGAHLLALEGMIPSKQGPVVLDIQVDPDVHMPRNGRFDFLNKALEDARKFT